MSGNKMSSTKISSTKISSKLILKWMNLKNKRMVGLSWIALMICLMPSANAGEIQLNVIYTNNCEFAKNEIALLGSPDLKVNTICSAKVPQGFGIPGEQLYDYRMDTTVVTPNDVVVGQIFQLSEIHTDNCELAKKEVSLLNSSTVKVDPVCSDYIDPPFTSVNGKKYHYRLMTTLTVLSL